MKPCAPLSPAARELLDLGSHVEPPRGDQIERMDRTLARLIALERAAPPTPPARLQPGTFGTRAGRGAAGSTAAPAWRALGSLLGPGAGKLALGAGALAATASASFWVGRISAPEPAIVSGVAPVGAHGLRGSDAAPAEPVALDLARAVLSPRGVGDAALAATPSALPPSAPTSATLTASAATPGALTPRAVAASSVLPPARHHARSQPISPAGLAAEVEQLARAEAALRQGRARRALAELEPPATHLVEQATALRAVAECALGQPPSAPSARQVLQRWPESALLPRIRAACGL